MLYNVHVNTLIRMLLYQQVLYQQGMADCLLIIKNAEMPFNYYASNQ